MQKVKLLIIIFIFPLLGIGCVCQDQKTPVDYVNAYIGNISHLLVPTYPTVHLPNSMLRVYAQRLDYTGDRLNGLPLFLIGHRGGFAFNLSPYQGDTLGLKPVVAYEYDQEVVKPYYYSVLLDSLNARVKYAPSHQSAVYEIDFNNHAGSYLILNSKKGNLKVAGNTISGDQPIGKEDKAYIYLETEVAPVSSGILSEQGMDQKVSGGSCVVLKFPKEVRVMKIRYGISFISSEQARKNLYREIEGYNVDSVAQIGRNIWNEKLNKISVQGNDEDQKTVFYTSIYRVCERPVCISEDGYYYSGFDKKVHNDNGVPFYTDDWFWDTFRAAHPLRVIMDPAVEQDMLSSYIRMAEERDNYWMPTFPVVTGDNHSMNSNHGVATFIDAYNKGLRNFNLSKAYEACKTAITEKTLIPWSDAKAGVLDEFYLKNGYFPSLVPGEQETVEEVNSFERRQPVAVTLGTVYDEWCLSQIAKALDKKEDYQYFLHRSLNYKKIFNPATKFFHPKDSRGNFIEPFDYRYSWGVGFRDAYDENNGWIYRWDLLHNIADLVSMIGGNQLFIDELERMYYTPLGQNRVHFYSQNADHTGNVGQFSMANEPCLHIPYLYNYAGAPWRTQKRVRRLLEQWFRNDVMGVPGDEDGGGLSAFVAFSSLGFYPITPGLPMYVIGSPVFERSVIKLDNGKTFEIVCKNYAPQNKYIQSATLNGKVWNKSWFSHEELEKGGKLELIMGEYPNKSWASLPESIPPSFEMVENRDSL